MIGIPDIISEVVDNMKTLTYGAYEPYEYKYSFTVLDASAATIGDNVTVTYATGYISGIVTAKTDTIIYITLEDEYDDGGEDPRILGPGGSYTIQGTPIYSFIDDKDYYFWFKPNYSVFVGAKIDITWSGGSALGTVTEVQSDFDLVSAVKYTKVRLTTDNEIGVGTSILTATMRLYFMHGHPLEIVNTLADKANASSYKGKRFPLIALYQDIEENIRNEGYERIAPVTVIIANQTDPNYSAATRQDNNFDPILYKLEEGFKYCLKKSEYIGGLKPDYNRIDRIYWGRNGIYGNEGNMFQDYIDAIELNNLELKIINT